MESAAHQSIIESNTLSSELSWLKNCVANRLNAFFKDGQETNNLPSPPELTKTDEAFSSFVLNEALSVEERLILILTLAPYLQPGLLDEVFYDYINQAGDFPPLGGIRGKHYRGLLPTGETAVFILSGNDFDQRLRLLDYLKNEATVIKKGIVEIDKAPDYEPFLNGVLRIGPEFLDLLLHGKLPAPVLSSEFPATRITTSQEWEDIVLKQNTREQINELFEWLKHHKVLEEEWGLAGKIPAGYKALFYGPPGTGKTLTASLLGKYTGKEVYKIDLSLVASKFIGETEKSLAKLFDKAEHREWILFFDEADALFGKRTNVKDAHDKHANQEVSYLLQRIEAFPGLVILATNFKNNIDTAFMRRFQSVIHFPLPGSDERLTLWKNGFPDHIKFEDNIDLPTIASDYEISGASIMNVVQYSCIKALARNETTIRLQDIRNGLKKEYAKEGRMF